MPRRKRSRPSKTDVVTVTVQGNSVEAWSIEKIGQEIGKDYWTFYKWTTQGLPKPFLVVGSRRYYPHEFALLIIEECKRYNVGKWQGFHQLHAVRTGNNTFAMINAVRSKWHQLDFWKGVQYNNQHSPERSKDSES